MSRGPGNLGFVKEFWIYTALRGALFVATAAIVFAVWSRFGAVPIGGVIIVAFLLSGVGSYFMLRNTRERLARKVEAGPAKRVQARFEEMRTKEDVD